jgi:hypothetical protein
MGAARGMYEVLGVARGGERSARQPGIITITSISISASTSICWRHPPPTHTC